MLTGVAGPYSRLTHHWSLVYPYRLLRGQFSVFGELSELARELHLPYHRILYGYLVGHLLPRRVDHMLRSMMGRHTGPPALQWIRREFAQRTRLSRRLAPHSKWRTLLNTGGGPRSILGDSLERGLYRYNRHAATCGMEMRHPYLDKRLFEFLYSIPPEQIYKGGVKRLVIRRAMRGILPEVVRLSRYKSDHGPFIHSALRHRSSAISPLFHKSSLCRLGVVDGQKLSRAYSDFVAQGRTERFLEAITLELWLRTCEDAFGQSPTVKEGQ